MMLWRLLWYFFGYYRISVPSDCHESAVIALYPSGVRQINEQKRGEISCFDFKKRDAEKANNILTNASIDVISVRECGVMEHLRKYRLRPGLAVGILFLMLCVFVSGRFLWSIA